MNPIPDWSCPIYFTGLGYGVLSPPLVFITLIQISEKYWLALQTTKNGNHVAKPVSVFAVPLTGVRLLDKTLSSPPLMGENLHKWEPHPASLSTTPVLTSYRAPTFNPQSHFSEERVFKKCVLWRQGKSYSKTRFITIVSKSNVKHFEIKPSDSEESAVLSQYVVSTGGVCTLPIITELRR